MKYAQDDIGGAGQETRQRFMVRWWREHEAELRKLWLEGYSASTIAQMLGPGIVTRNAVIGKVNRLGDLPRRASTRPNPNAQRRPRKRLRSKLDRWLAKPTKPGKYVRPPLPDEPVSLSMSLLDLSAKACRWPHGDGEFTFCGHRQTAGSSYCEYHRQRSEAPR